MNRHEMNSLMKRIASIVSDTRDAGQNEYARDSENVFANFDRVGETLNLKREKVLMVYLLKHIDGIIAYIDGHKSQRENISGRITDSIVYLLLLQGMFEDDKDKQS